MRAHTVESTHMSESTEEGSRAQDREADFARAGAVETHMEMSQKPCCLFTGKMLDPNPARGISCENLQEKCRSRIPTEKFCVEIYRINAGLQFCRARRTLCARLRSRNARGHFRRAILRGNLQEKCRTPISGHPFCASQRNRNAHGHFTRTIFFGNLKEKRSHTIPPTSIEHPALTVTVRTPQCGHTVWGISMH